MLKNKQINKQTNKQTKKKKTETQVGLKQTLLMI